MLNEILHSFFFWMPAVVAVAIGFEMKSPPARLILVWGGGAFALVIGAAVLGMLMCDGKSLSVYTNCAGGPVVERVFAGAHPFFVAVTYAYIFAGPLLAGVAYLLEWRHSRRAKSA
ncbi:MAG: hypothetical protein QNJ44_14655 [Rhodobacter sp.]|nr:hypothetical protein [Rhodobacter sp.]